MGSKWTRGGRRMRGPAVFATRGGQGLCRPALLATLAGLLLGPGGEIADGLLEAADARLPWLDHAATAAPADTQGAGKQGAGKKGARGRPAPSKRQPASAPPTKRQPASAPALASPPEPPAPLVTARARVARDPASARGLLETVLQDPSATPFHPEAHALAGAALDALQLPTLALAQLEQALEPGPQSPPSPASSASPTSAASSPASAAPAPRAPASPAPPAPVSPSPAQQPAAPALAGPQAPWFATAFATAARLARQTHQETGLEALCLRLDPDSLPAPERSYARYLAGRALEAADQPARAIPLLTQLEPADPDFVPARLVMANAFNRMRKRSLAVATLQDLATTHAALLEKTPRLREVVALNRARACYGAGQVEQAVALYREIPRASTTWLEAQQELAWAHYRQFAVAEDLRALNAALGDLHTLTAPFFSDRYLPEPALLEIQILYQLCRVVDGGRKLETFLPRYTAWRDGLKAALALDAARPGQLLKEVLEARHAPRPDAAREADGTRGSAAREADGTRGGAAREIDGARSSAAPGADGASPGSALPVVFVDRFRDRPDLDALEAALHGIAAERQRLETLSGPWAGALHDQLAAQLTAREATLRQTAALELRRELETVLADLSDMLGQAQLARLDMVTAEKDLYEAAAAGTLPRAKKARGQRPWWLTAANREVWPFEGEYWSDELGFYVGNAAPLCPE